MTMTAEASTPAGAAVPEHVVDARAVYRTFEQDTAPVRALRGADLSVARGEFVAIMGPSGCGKSTLLNIIAGLDIPDEGEVVVAGQSLIGLDEDALAIMRRRQVGIVFQFFNLLDDLTVRDNVLLPAQLAGARPAAARARTDELLDQLGIVERAHAYPARLSGGERQRVAIARALVNRPALLLADEPTGAVDGRTGAAVAQILRELAGGGQSLLLVTHDSALARSCTDREVVLVDGRVALDEVRVVSDEALFSAEEPA
jgi:putative ABC transport system ATP-binding protein